MTLPRCSCGCRHQTYRTLAKCKWPRAEWIRGDGRYALLAHCRVLTVALHQTHESAENSKHVIDTSACGGHCHNNHEIIDLDMKTSSRRNPKTIPTQARLAELRQQHPAT